MKDYTLSTIGSVTSWAFTIAQTNEILQFIMFIMSIISTAFTIAFIIFKWYNKAKEDGKITKEEIEDLADDISEALGNKEDKEK
jgi:Na+/melibiose symporter-like transporter